MHYGREIAPAGVWTLPRRRLPWSGRLRAAFPDAALLALVLVQLLPFLSAFHQSADDNFWQFVALATTGDVAGLAEKTQDLAQQQGRVGIYAAMPLVLLGAVLPEYAWGRVLVVALFGLLLLAFCHAVALRFATPLTRAALLLTVSVTPMAAYHLPPNAYPLLVTVPLLALVAIHLRLAAAAPLPRRARAAVSAALAALMLLLEYAFVAGLALAALAVVTAAGAVRRRRALLLHGPALLASAVAYLAYRAAFPSRYPGNALEAATPLETLHLQALHLANGTVFPHLAPAAPAGAELLAAAGVFAAGTWLSARLLPALARALRPGAALGVALACAGWAWLNTLPHALTPKYQAWCRLGECAYVDSRVAALGVGAAAAVGIAALLRLVEGRATRAARVAALLCAAAVGAAGAATFLHNRAAAREMAWRERPFAALRSAACAAGADAPGAADLGRDPEVLRALARTVWWPPPPAEVPPAEAYLATYRDSLARLGLACRPVPFAPAPGPVEFLDWSAPEPTGRWSHGPAGILLLPRGGGTTGVVLTLAAYVPPGHGPRRVVARTPGAADCTLRLDGSPRELFVPWTAGAGAGEQLLVLETPDAVSPSAAGESADRRVLGVFLSAARPARPGEMAPAGLDLRDCRGGEG